MKMKRFTALLLTGALAAGLLAGCGGAPSAAPSGSGAAPEGGAVTLSVYGGTSPMKEAIDQMTTDYKAQTGVTVEWEIPGDEPYTLLKTRFASNEAPDIFDLANGDYATWSVRCADLTGADWVSHMDETALAAATVDGRVLGFPYAVEGNGIVYNKALFAQAGIDKVPETLDELEDTCKKLQAAGIQPFGEAFKEWGFLMHIFGTTVAYEKDPKAFCDELNAGTKTLGDLANIDNFFRLYDLTLDYGKGAESVGYGAADQVADFAAGKMAMIKQGTWYGDPLWATNPDLDIGLFAVPLTNNAADTKLMTSATRYFSVANTSKHAAEAGAFLNWIYENAQKYLVDSAMRVAPPYDNVDLSNLGALNEDMQRYLAEGKAFPIFGTEYFPSGFVTDIATPLQAYAAGMADEAATIDALQKAYENRLTAQGG